MANDIQRMVKEPVTTGLVFLIEDFVLFEETMMNNPKIKSNLQNTQFWVELADIVKADIYEALKEKTDIPEDYDYDTYKPSDKKVLEYLMNSKNRVYLNDMIDDAVANWLKHNR